MKEHSIEWFRWHRDNHAERLGVQAHKLLELYEQLERKAQEELLVGLYNNDIISQIQFDAGMELITEEFAARQESE